jgi:hypothetical protein
LYRQVVEASTERSLAAQALVRIGQNYERMGRDGALEAYRRVVTDFGDQPEPLGIARQRLALLVAPAGNGPSPTKAKSLSWSDVDFPSDLYSWGASLSPSGRLIAAVDGNGGIHILDRTTGANSLLVPGQPAGEARFVRFSPDERMLAYGWFDGEGRGYIKVTDLQTSETRTVLDLFERFPHSYEDGFDPYVLDWTEDGSQLLAYVYADTDDRPGYAYLMMIPLSGEPSTILGSDTEVDSWTANTGCLAGGDRFVFLRFSPGDHSQQFIQRIDRQTGESIRWRDGGSDQFILSGCPQNGDAVVYVARYLAENFLFSAAPDSAPSSEPDEMLVAVDPDFTALSISDNGDLLAEWDAWDNRKLLALDLEAGDNPELDVVLAEGKRVQLGSWDPSGTRYAWASYAPRELHIWNSETKEREVFALRRPGIPFWFPDGERIGVRNLAGDDQLSIVDLKDGSESESVYEGRVFASGPDGRSVLIPDGVCVVRRPLDGTEPSPFFCLEDPEATQLLMRELDDYSGYSFEGRRKDGSTLVIGRVDSEGNNPEELYRPSPLEVGFDIRYSIPGMLTIAEKSNRQISGYQIAALVDKLYKVDPVTGTKTSIWESVLEVTEVRNYRFRPDGRMAIATTIAPRREAGSLSILHQVLGDRSRE